MDLNQQRNERIFKGSYLFSFSPSPFLSVSIPPLLSLFPLSLERERRGGRGSRNEPLSPLAECQEGL